MKVSGLKFDNPEEFNKWINNNIDYGIVYNGKKYREPNDLFDEHPDGLDPVFPTTERFLKDRMGHCWQFVELEREVFKQWKQYRTATFMIFITEKLSGKLLNSHSFLVYTERKNTDDCYYFESAFWPYRGIKEFNNIKNLYLYVMRSVVNNLLKQNDIMERDLNIHIFEYKPITPGMKNSEIVRNIEKTGRLVYDNKTRMTRT